MRRRRRSGGSDGSRLTNRWRCSLVTSDVSKEGFLTTNRQPSLRSQRGFTEAAIDAAGDTERFPERRELPESERLRRSRDAPDGISQLVPNVLLRASANKTLVGTGWPAAAQPAATSVGSTFLAL